MFAQLEEIHLFLNQVYCKKMIVKRKNIYISEYLAELPHTMLEDVINTIWFFISLSDQSIALIQGAILSVWSARLEPQSQPFKNNMVQCAVAMRVG